MKEVAARRAANFLAFTRKLNQSKHDYEQNARALLEWVQATIERFAAEGQNLGQTLEEALAVTERLRAFILHEKPAKTAAKLDLESQYAEIQQTLLVHDRPAYECPAEYTPDTLDSAFDSLWDAEKTYATAARVNRFRFITKTESTVTESQLAEMKESYATFDKDGDGAMDKTELKAALSAMSIPIKDDATLTAMMARISEGTGSISLDQWVRFNTENLSDKDTPEQIAAAFRTLANDADTISADSLRVPPLTEEDVAYLAESMPPAENGNGLDYRRFVEASFVAKEPPQAGQASAAAAAAAPAAAAVAAPDAAPAEAAAAEPAATEAQ